MWDDADVMLAGGAEASVSRIGYAGFAAARALSTSYNDNPTQGSRPFDEGRDGFVMGEGAGVVVLEELEHAKKRGATIYGEIVGYGLSGDAYHITSPPPDGNGAFRAMKAALKRAGIGPEAIDYVNAHGTSTPVGDEIEVGAVKRLMGSSVDRVSMSSTKSSIGHLLGAAGAVEAIYSLMAITRSVAPATLNLVNPYAGRAPRSRFGPGAAVRSCLAVRRNRAAMLCRRASAHRHATRPVPRRWCSTRHRRRSGPPICR